MFSEILKDLIKEKGISQRQLSINADIPTTTISGWLNANRLPDYSALKKLADYFNVTTDYLLGREDELGNVATGAAPNLTAQEQALLVAFRKLDDRRRTQLVADAEYYASKKVNV